MLLSAVSIRPRGPAQKKDRIVFSFSGQRLQAIAVQEINHINQAGGLKIGAYRARMRYPFCPRRVIASIVCMLRHNKRMNRRARPKDDKVHISQQHKDGMSEARIDRPVRPPEAYNNNWRAAAFPATVKKPKSNLSQNNTRTSTGGGKEGTRRAKRLRAGLLAPRGSRSKEEKRSLCAHRIAASWPLEDNQAEVSILVRTCTKMRVHILNKHTPPLTMRRTERQSFSPR